jgi:hypothetical protein
VGDRERRRARVIINYGVRMRLSLIYPGGKGTQMLQSALARSLARTLVANGLNHFIGKSINYSLHTWLRERASESWRLHFSLIRAIQRL